MEENPKLTRTEHNGCIFAYPVPEEWTSTDDGNDVRLQAPESLSLVRRAVLSELDVPSRGGRVSGLLNDLGYRDVQILRASSPTAARDGFTHTLAEFQAVHDGLRVHGHVEFGVRGVRATVITLSLIHAAVDAFVRMRPRLFELLSQVRVRNQSSYAYLLEGRKPEPAYDPASNGLSGYAARGSRSAIAAY